MSDIIPAATVMLIRPSSSDGIEVLLLKRNKKLKFAPSFWVFPGGRLDAADGGEDEDEMMIAKKAAARELQEEAGISIATHDFTPFYHWTTPLGESRRFGTWFFHTNISADQQVIIDDGEIVDYQWLSPAEALERHMAHELPMLPPTFISLRRIKNAKTYADALTEYDRTGVIDVVPRMIRTDGAMHLLYPGDSGYETINPSLMDAQHRLIIEHKPKMVYQFLYENCDIPPISGGIEFDL